MAARIRRTERCKTLRLACWNADGVRGKKLELEYFLGQHGVDICLLSETFLNRGQAFRLTNCLPPQRQNDNWGRHSHLVPPWYSPPLSARSEPDSLGSYCHPSHICWHAGTNPRGLPFTFPTTDRGGPDRLFWRGIAGLDGWRHQRQTRGMVLTAEHETVVTPT